MSKRDRRKKVCELHRRVEELEQIVRGNADYASMAIGGPTRIVFRVITTKGETFYQNLFIPGLRFRSSIDATTGDNGFLGGVSNAYQGAINANSVDRHTDTAHAFADLRNGSADFSIIVGHGASGIINTGNGQVTDGGDKYMSLGNQADWTAIASQGIPGNRLVLFGCEVAKDQAGAAFIQRMANVVRKEVGAWDGLVYSGVQNGLPATWGTGNFRTASPGGIVEPVTAAELFEENDQMELIRLRIAGEYEDLAYGVVTSVTFTPVGSAALKTKPLNVEKAGIATLLKMIDFSRPLVFDDKLGSILVGQLTVSFELDGEVQMRTFRVLGYSVLQDVCFPDTYYYASSKLRGALQTD